VADSGTAETLPFQCRHAGFEPAEQPRWRQAPPDNITKERMMMKNQKQWTLGLAVCLALSGGGILQSWGAPAEKPKMERMEAPGNGPESNEDPGRWMMSKLNLTDDQLAKLKPERLDMRKQMIRNMADMKMLHLDLAEETMNDKPDMNHIDKLVKQIGELQTQMLSGHIKSVIHLRSILTPEQKRKLDELHAGMGWEGPMGPMGPGRQGRDGGKHTGPEDK
jgi:Spy/CpxP family protein refolding chaperone